LLALNRSSAFKLLPNGNVEHDLAVVKTMQLKIDEQGQDIAFCDKIMAQPVTFLPKKELVISAPIFVPMSQQKHNKHNGPHF